MKAGVFGEVLRPVMAGLRMTLSVIFDKLLNDESRDFFNGIGGGEFY